MQNDTKVVLSSWIVTLSQDYPWDVENGPNGIETIGGEIAHALGSKHIHDVVDGGLPRFYRMVASDAAALLLATKPWVKDVYMPPSEFSVYSIKLNISGGSAGSRWRKQALMELEEFLFGRDVDYIRVRRTGEINIRCSARVRVFLLEYAPCRRFICSFRKTKE